MDYYDWPWPPIEIINEGSVWQWLAPVGAVIGSVLLFTGGLIGVYLTNRNASGRHRTEMDAAQRQHEQQLAAMRGEARADRIAQRNDRLREEVGNLIGEKWATNNVAFELAEAAGQFFRDREEQVAPNKRFRNAVDVRNEHTPQLNKVEHLAIRASLLTDDREISGVLDEIRTVAQLWKDLIDNDPYEKFIEIRERLETAFTKLETLTRTLVTSDGVG